MKRLYPLRDQAERRCTAPSFQTATGGNCSLAAGGRCPVRRASWSIVRHRGACQTLRLRWLWVFRP